MTTVAIPMTSATHYTCLVLPNGDPPADEPVDVSCCDYDWSLPTGIIIEDPVPVGPPVPPTTTVPIPSPVGGLSSPTDALITDCENQAGDCGSDGWPAAGQVGIEIAGTGVYIDDRNFVLGNGFWIYLESNSQHGLQRGGVHPVLGTADEEICNESGNPDTLLL